MLREVIIKEINVKIREIIKWIIKWIIKKIMKEIKCYLEDDDCYLKIGFIRVKNWLRWWCLIWIWW